MDFPTPQNGAGTGSPNPSNPLSPNSPQVPTDSFIRTAIDKLKGMGGALRKSNSPYEDEEKIKKLCKDFKTQSFEDRWVFERQWQRAIHYERNRQWIWYNSKAGEWQDKRLARWMPKPVINKCSESTQALMSMFAATRLGVKVRPKGEGPEALATSTVADEIEPFICEEHGFEEAQAIADHWFVLMGNYYLHPFWDRDPNGHKSMVPAVTCPKCNFQATWDLSPDSECETCGTPLEVATGPSGALIQREEVIGRGKTEALSDLEIAYPLTYQNWNELPGLIRLRWRDVSYYESRKYLQDMVSKINWSDSAKDRSLQIFRALPLLNDSGVVTGSGANVGQTPKSKGIGEYEYWFKPTDDFPDGLVVRMTDDDQIIHAETDEGLPGPIPYKDINNNALFPFVHAAYKEMGGRIIGSGALDPVLQIQDAINRLMSLIEMIVQRTANPLWLEEKGSEVEKFTGEPGIVVKWNSYGKTKEAPARIPGENIPSTLFKLMDQLYKVFEEEIGTFDILKGQKPAGIDSFAGLQLMVERSQSRFSSAFKARGRAYRDWYSLSLEMERQYGPTTRTEAVLGPNQKYIFRHFKKADLQGAVTIITEDGSTVPKTQLGLRASLEQAKGMGLLDPNDPDQRYYALSVLGVTDIDPSLDAQVQSAHRKQEAFEQYLLGKKFNGDATGSLMPLVMKEWHSPIVHERECIKWANSDRMVDLFAQYPQAEQIVSGYLQQVRLLLGVMPGMPPPPGGVAKPGAAPAPAGGNGTPMANAARETGKTAVVPSGNKQTVQNQGPV